MNMIVAPRTSVTEVISALTERANDYAVASYGKCTRRTYESGFAHYVGWCRQVGRTPLCGDPATIALYVTAAAGEGHTFSTIRVRLAAIRTAHRMANVAIDMADPVLVSVIEGIARTHGTRASRQAAAATPDILRPMVASRRPANTAWGARDRAMLLIGFGAALRQSELVALHIGDIEHVRGRGLRVLIRRSKTDQHGAGGVVSIVANALEPDLCAATAFERWMEHRKLADDRGAQDRPLFCRVDPRRKMSGDALCDHRVAELVKDAAKGANLDPSQFSGHSLRRGLATAAAEGGASLPDLMRHTRHKSTRVAMAYIDHANEWNRNASDMAFRGRAA